MPRQQTYRPSLEVLEDRDVPTTFVVSNLGDNGFEQPLIPGSLRRAVERANSHPGRDTIIFKPGLQGTIKLQLGAILISDDLALTGPGAARIKIDGNDLDRIFTVFDFLPGGNAETVRTVTVSGLTLFNGSADVGGAIANAGEDLTLRGMVIRNNVALAGGGIYTVGPLRTERCRIVANQGESGGGLALTFEPSSFPSAPEVAIVDSKINGNESFQ